MAFKDLIKVWDWESNILYCWSPVYFKVQGTKKKYINKYKTTNIKIGFTRWINQLLNHKAPTSASFYTSPLLIQSSEPWPSHVDADCVPRSDVFIWVRVFKKKQYANWFFKSLTSRFNKFWPPASRSSLRFSFVPLVSTLFLPYILVFFFFSLFLKLCMCVCVYTQCSFTGLWTQVLTEGGNILLSPFWFSFWLLKVVWTVRAHSGMRWCPVRSVQRMLWPFTYFFSRF